MEKQTDVMLVGLGSIGGWALEFLVREPSICKIAVTDVREIYGTQKLNAALSGAHQMGYQPEVQFFKMDLTEDIEKNAEIIKKVNPRLIASSVVMWTGWRTGAILPYEITKPLTDVAGLGPYIALQLRLLYRLMLAVKASGVDAYVLNASYPDVTGPCLKTQGLECTVGIGNVDIMAGLVKQQVAECSGHLFMS